jgi:hypothetical protein
MRMKTGDKLGNGAIVIDATDNVVFAHWESGYHPYVTWNHNGPNDTYWGHYHKTFMEGAKEFAERAQANHNK